MLKGVRWWRTPGKLRGGDSEEQDVLALDADVVPVVVEVDLIREHVAALRVEDHEGEIAGRVLRPQAADDIPLRLSILGDAVEQRAFGEIIGRGRAAGRGVALRVRVSRASVGTARKKQRDDGNTAERKQVATGRIQDSSRPSRTRLEWVVQTGSG